MKDNWYFFGKKSRKFSEAKLQCEELGAKLFEPGNLHIQNTILDLYSHDWLWLGISKIGKYPDKEWQWLSNNSMNNWARERARSIRNFGNNCIYLTTISRKWYETSCL